MFDHFLCQLLPKSVLIDSSRHSFKPASPLHCIVLMQQTLKTARYWNKCPTLFNACLVLLHFTLHSKSIYQLRQKLRCLNHGLIDSQARHTNANCWYISNWKEKVWFSLQWIKQNQAIYIFAWDTSHARFSKVFQTSTRLRNSQIMQFHAIWEFDETYHCFPNAFFVVISAMGKEGRYCVSSLMIWSHMWCWYFGGCDMAGGGWGSLYAKLGNKFCQMSPRAADSETRLPPSTQKF